VEFIPKLSGNYSLDKPEAAPPAEPAKEKDAEKSSSESDSNFNARTVWDTEADEAKVTLRLKSAAGAGLALLIIYGLIATFSGGSRHSSERRLQAAAEERAEPEDRSIEHARAKAGFFNRIFCGGLRRASFCD